MKIGIIGLGLIGGSIYKKLMSLGYEVIAISQSQNNKAKNITDDITKISDCKIIFVATPMNKTLEMLDEVSKYVTEETIVTDVCSLKSFLTRKDYPYKFIPSHPMAGTEFQGFENSDAELFKDAKWVLTPKNNHCDEKLIQIIKEMGAFPILTTAEEHDKSAAIISHMPMVIAQALVSIAQKDKLALKLASSGFRDMTRLALSNTEMAEDMVNLNHKNIETALLMLYSELGDLISKNYPEKIKELKTLREKMYKDGKNCL